MDKEKLKADGIDEVSTFSTRDLGEASFLYAKGYQLLRLDWEDEVAIFVFADDGKAAKMADSYWDETGAVTAKSLVDSMKSLKDRLFARR